VNAYRLLLFCIAISTPLLAQEKETVRSSSFKELREQLRPGDRIRIQRNSTARYGDLPRFEVGQLREISADGSRLVLAGEGGDATFLESDVERVDLGSRYTKTFALPGALIGAAAGFGAFAWIVGSSCEQPDCEGSDYAVAFGAALGAPLGALVGFGLGRSHKSESTSWEPVYASAPRARVSIFPIVGRHRTGAGLSIAF
jgi:hypothetical protein